MRKSIDRIIRPVMLSIAVSAAGAAEQQDTVKVEKIVERALGLMEQVGGISAVEDRLMTATDLASGRQVTTWTTTQAAVRDPGLYLYAYIVSDGIVGVTWSDGKVRRDFVRSPHAEQFARRQPGRKPYSPKENIGGWAGTDSGHYRRSPGAAYSIFGSMYGDGPRYFKYLGRKDIRGDACDAIEVRLEMDKPTWARTRARYPQVPEAGAVVYTYYIGVSDGLLRRSEENGWAIKAVDGTEPDYPNTQTESRTDYRYGPPPPESEFTLARLDARIAGAMGPKKAPPLVKVTDPFGVNAALLGKALPDIGLTTLDGTPVRWEDFRGQVIVIETWFIGCTQCKHAFPLRQAASAAGRQALRLLPRTQGTATTTARRRSRIF